MSLDELKSDIKKCLKDNINDKALNLINKGLKQNPFDGSLYYYMSLAYENTKNYDLAYLSLENAMAYSNDKHSLKDKLKVIHEKSNVNNFSIIIITYNNLNYTKECINSIKKNNKLNNYEIIVVDNNSTDGTVSWLKSQKDIKCIFNSNNIGFPKGCNKGIKNASKANDIFLLNNDTIVTPNSIFTLRMALYSNKNIGSVSPSSNSAPYQNIIKSFDTKEEYINYAKEINIPSSKMHEYRLKLIGFALFIKREALNKTGYLDEIFTPGNYEDDDLGLRLIKKSYYNLYCKDSFIYHYGHASFKNNENNYYNLLRKNREKFNSKWGFDPVKSLCYRDDVIELIDENKDSKFNVLDIGCACGGTLLKIKNNYPNANIYGIDKNNSFKDIVNKFADIKILDIENDLLDYNENFFDYILLADLLQYIDNPLKLLVNLKKYLKKHGHIIACVINANNFKIIKSLLNGDYFYNNEGIIFNDRVNKFTYKDIKSLFENANYKNIYVTSMASNIDHTDINFINKLTNLSEYEDIKDELINYEYYIKATKTLLPFEDVNNEFNIIIKELDKNYNNISLLNNLLKLIIDNNLSYKYITSNIINKTNNPLEILNSISLTFHKLSNTN